MDYFDEKPEKIFANQYSEQQILASGNASQNIDSINSRCTALENIKMMTQKELPKKNAKIQGIEKLLMSLDSESDTQVINTNQNLDKKQVEEELVGRYSIRERKETNSTIPMFQAQT
ncbi:21439_t:CDS:2 [Dentiscutata erythropus]|uniref:21439_t:CDS:1 n=1 Tax=Dentiscutata erythropus TaxID=1348616 RepID=A0A9N9HSA6_9GLOM|nr:21439_t:CDS:2 [Dentiscutata erythropus]